MFESTSAKVQLIHVQKPLLHHREKNNCTLATIGHGQVDLDLFSCISALVSSEPSNLRTLNWTCPMGLTGSKGYRIIGLLPARRALTRPGRVPDRLTDEQLQFRNYLGEYLIPYFANERCLSGLPVEYSNEAHPFKAYVTRSPDTRFP